MTTTIEERARGVVVDHIARFESASPQTLTPKGEALVEAITTAMREVVEECAKATCSGCLNEFLVETNPHRPDEFWHKEKINDGRFLCSASAIRARFKGGDDEG